jgi:hypothetical protein
MQENNYIMLLTLVGLSYQYDWLRTETRRALWIGSTALGLNVLTRVTTAIDVLAVGVFLLMVLLFERATTRKLWTRVSSYCKVALPVYAVFALTERFYSYYRFGSFTQTYLPIFAREMKAQDPTLPANFPWSTPMHEGILGALFKPEKSIFLFDPLILLAILLIVMLWSRLENVVRAYVVCSIFLLFGYLCFYARYTYWAGDFAWGDRYVSTAVQMVAMLAVPLLLRYHAYIGRWAQAGAVLLIAISFVVQLASLMFWLPLEIYQMETLGHPTFVIALRFKNIAAFALGKMDAWGLNNDEMGYDQWDYVHITTWNFFPFLLRRVGAAPRWAVDLAFVAWGAGLVALSAALFRLETLIQTQEQAWKERRQAYGQ